MLCKQDRLASSGPRDLFLDRSLIHNFRYELALRLWANAGYPYHIRDMTSQPPVMPARGNAHDKTWHADR